MELRLQINHCWYRLILVTEPTSHLSTYLAAHLTLKNVDNPNMTYKPEALSWSTLVTKHRISSSDEDMQQQRAHAWLNHDLREGQTVVQRTNTTKVVYSLEIITLNGWPQVTMTQYNMTTKLHEGSLNRIWEVITGDEVISLEVKQVSDDATAPWNPLTHVRDPWHKVTTIKQDIKSMVPNTTCVQIHPWNMSLVRTQPVVPATSIHMSRTDPTATVFWSSDKRTRRYCVLRKTIAFQSHRDNDSSTSPLPY